MTLVIPPGHAQVQLRWSLAGDAEVMISTFGCEYTILNADAQLAAEEIADAWESTHAPTSLADDYTFIGVKMLVGQDGGPPSIVEAVRAVDGSSGNPPLPQNCCVLVKKSTSLGGRSGRGRMYLPGGYLQEGLVAANGVLDSSYRADLNTDMTSFLIAVTMEILHDSESPGDLDPTPVIGLTVDTRIATQRRRLR